MGCAAFFGPGCNFAPQSNPTPPCFPELQRGESQVEKQVKEARTKCRSIASLLTDAPNPNSKGVLMFKKRRQRAKKYTLTCFGKVEGDGGGDTEGETEGDTEEEGGSSVLSGSELDENGFSASFDPTWDSGYLDLLDRKSSACPSATPTAPTTPTTPTANCGSGLDVSTYQSPGFPSPVLPLKPECLANHSPRLDCGVGKQQTSSHPAVMSPPAVTLTNGGPVAISRASVLLTPLSQAPITHLNGLHPDAQSPEPGPDHLSASPSNVLNRTARPFTPGPSASRASVTSVMFRPPQPRAAVAAVSAMAIPSGPDTRRAVSSTSLYIPPRNGNTNGTAPAPSDPPHFPIAQSHPLPVAPPPASPQMAPWSPSVLPPLQQCPAPQFPPSALLPSTNLTHTTSFSVQPSMPGPPPQTHPAPPPTYSCNNMTVAVSSSSHNMAAVPAAVLPAAAASSLLPQPHADAPVSREQRIAVPAARTGILHDTRRRSSKKPMFANVQKTDVSPNPDLMSMVQNMDGHYGTNAAPESAGHESGPEEDWLRLGAEACNFMQTQRGPRPPPVAPKPQAPAQVPQLRGRGGELFARRQSRMDRYVVERSPSVAAAPYSHTQTRESSPTPSLPATWKYSSNIRAPPPISYNPLLSPSCPPKAQKKPEMGKSGNTGAKDKKKPAKCVDVSAHQPYQLQSSLFTYGSGAPAQDPPAYQQQGTVCAPQKTAPVCEVKRFSTPPPAPSSRPSLLKVITPRSATTLGEPLWRSDLTSPPPVDSSPFQPQWAASPLSPPPPPAPTAPLPQLPTFASLPTAKPCPSFVSPHLQPTGHAQPRQQFCSVPDLSPQGGPRPASCGPPRVPRPRFSTSSLGLQPSVWRPGSVMQ